MTSKPQTITDWYHFLFEDLADPRVKSYFLMDSPFPLVFLLAFYYVFVQRLGPQLMKNREPFQLKSPLILYNVTQIAICLYFVVQHMRHTFFRYSLRCEPIDWSNDEFPVFMTRQVWLFLILKVFDLLDTVFFVLRKKSNQITFLHVYHHAGMCVLGWVGTKFVPGGHGVFIGFLNSIVHVIMYFYYLFSVWDEKYKKSIWWKKYVTLVQIIQFIIFTVYFGQVLFQPDCAYPRWVIWLFLPNNLLIMSLFINYYIRAYVLPQKNISVKSDVKKKLGQWGQNDRTKSECRKAL